MLLKLIKPSEFSELDDLDEFRELHLLELLILDYLVVHQFINFNELLLNQIRP